MGSWSLDTVQPGVCRGFLKIKKKEIFQQVKTSKGKVFVYPAYFHFPSTKAIRASYKSLSLHVFVYFIVFVGLVFAIEFVYLSGLASDNGSAQGSRQKK